MDLIAFLLAAALAGLIVGAIARLLVPGPDPLGLLGTIGVGTLGSIVGGFIGWAFFGENYAPGFLLAIIGAVLVLIILRAGAPTTR